jgi:hypothetical protein
MVDFSPIDTYVDTETIKERAKELIGLAEKVYPGELTDVFASEHRDAEGRQAIESIWLFTGNCVGEIKNVTSGEESYDLTPLRKSVLWVQVSFKEFDLETPSDSSRLTVEFALVGGISGTLRATRGNCLHLFKILKEKFHANMVA